MFLNVLCPNCQLQFCIPNHRLFKSKAATAGQMKVVIFFPPSIILAFLSTVCHYGELHLVICVLWPDTCAQREPICVGGASRQRRRLISDQWAYRGLEDLSLVCFKYHFVLLSCKINLSNQMCLGVNRQVNQSYEPWFSQMNCGSVIVVIRALISSKIVFFLMSFMFMFLCYDMFFMCFCMFYVFCVFYVMLCFYVISL